MVGVGENVLVAERVVVGGRGDVDPRREDEGTDGECLTVWNHFRPNFSNKPYVSDHTSLFLIRTCPAPCLLALVSLL